MVVGGTAPGAAHTVIRHVPDDPRTGLDTVDVDQPLLHGSCDVTASGSELVRQGLCAGFLPLLGGGGKVVLTAVQEPGRESADRGAARRGTGRGSQWSPTVLNSSSSGA
ncbi:hypothetical protein ACFYT4_17085 [Streptomyces sp. NPDC004609]|uniref:hypothetical protein n=1 Tax=Streptomyces sp. NPDC004609 TaxID=3364704 RepID=UPI0036D11B96